MILRKFEIKIYLLLFIVIIVRSADWTITSKDPNNNNIEIIKGQYTKTDLLLTRNTVNSSDIYIILSIKPEEDNDLMMLTPISIQSEGKSSLEITAYFGLLSVSKSIGSNLNINLILIEGNPKQIELPPLTYTIIPSSPTMVFPSLSKILPINPHGRGEFKLSMTNTEEVKINFHPSNNTNHPYANIPNIIIPPFTLGRLAKVRYYYNTNYIVNLPKQIFTIDMSETYYTTSNTTIEFDVLEDPLPDFNPSQRKDILDNTALVETDADSSTIVLEFGYLPKNVLMYCVIQDDHKLPLDDTLRNKVNRYTKSSRMNMFHKVITEGMVRITFDSMSIYARLYIRCVIDNIPSKVMNFKSMNITIGKLNNADIHTEVRSFYNKPVTTQCATWEFLSGVNMTLFKKAMIKHCNQYLLNKVNEEASLFEHTCPQCIISISPLLSDKCSMVQLCFESNHQCKGNPTQNDHTSFIKLFDNYTALLDSETKIMNELLFPNYLIQSLTRQYEDTFINSTMINTTIKSMSIDKVSLVTNSTLSQVIECYVHKLIDNVNDISEDEFNYDKTIIVSPGIPSEYELDFPIKEYNSAIYSIYLLCYNLPGIKSRTTNSNIMNTRSFYHRENYQENLLGHKGEYAIERNYKDNCLINPLLPQCIVRNYSYFPNISTNYTKDDNSEEMKRFFVLDQVAQVLALYKRSTVLKLIKDKETMIKEASLLCYVGSYNNCLTSIDYKTCILTKMSFIRNIINTMVTVFPSDAHQIDSIVKEMDKNHKKTSKNYNDILIKLYKVFHFIPMNSNSFTDSTFNQLLSYISNAFVNNNITYGDSSNILFQIDLNILTLCMLANLLEVLKYKPSNINPQTNSLIVTEDMFQLPNGINKVLTKIRKAMPSDHISPREKYSTIQYAISKKTTGSDSHNNTITFNQDISVVIPFNEIFALKGIEMIMVVLYHNYPLMNGFGGSVSNQFISIRYYHRDNYDNDIKDIIDLPKDLRPKIIITQKDNSKYNQCVYLDDNDGNVFKSNGVITTINNNTITCTINTSHDITLQYSPTITLDINTQHNENKGINLIKVIVIPLIIVIILCFFIVIFIIRRRKRSANPYSFQPIPISLEAHHTK